MTNDHADEGLVTNDHADEDTNNKYTNKEIKKQTYYAIIIEVEI